jgi:hypothetical protein
MVSSYNTLLVILYVIRMGVDDAIYASVHV